MRRAGPPRGPNAGLAVVTGALLAALAIAVACSARPASRAPRVTTAATSDVAAYYDSPGLVPEAKLTLVETDREYEVWKVSLPARHGEPAWPAEKKAISMRWYRPTTKPGRRPAVIVSPILGSDTAFIEGFSIRFAKEGWHALVVKRPKVEFDESRGVEQVEDGLRASVARQKQALDWLLTRPGVDPQRIGSFGISAGGIQNAMVAGADDRYVAHVLGLAGGPLSDVFADTEEKSLRKLFERAQKKSGTTKEELRALLEKTIRTDPVKLAPRVDRERVLLVIAEHDHSVPTACGHRLYEALGRPETVFLPLGHYTSVVALPFVEERTVRFLRDRLEPPSDR